MPYFTKYEREIIQHRLDVRDAIEDCFLDTDEYTWTAEEIAEAIEGVERRLNADAAEKPTGLASNAISRAWEGMSDCEKAVLQDCLEGSTWCAVHYDHYNDNVKLSEGLVKACFTKVENK